MTNEKELTHIDLFSGIGGFTLAAEWAGFRTVVFCEKEKFCQKVLKKHWPEVPIIEEIRDFDGTEYKGTTLLTGGFPCQPFSVAGQRRGKKDDRYLWPEMLKVIDEAKPHWILAENVSGIFRMALDTVLADLEGEGYTTGTFIIPACGLNAPHRRNRIWIIANSRCQYGERTKNKGKFKRSIPEKEDAPLSERSIKNDGFRDAQNTIETGTRNQNRKIGDQKRRISQNRREGIRQEDGKISSNRFASTNKNACNTSGNRHSGRCEEARGAERKGKQGRLCEPKGTNSHAPDSKIGGIQGRSISIRQRQSRQVTCDIERNRQDAPDSEASFIRGIRHKSKEKRPQNGDELLGGSHRLSWQENWYEIATRFCRVDDGVSDRIHRLKALGNAIVPQVAYEILKRIAWIEKEIK